MPIARVKIFWFWVEQLPGHFELISDLIPTLSESDRAKLTIFETFFSSVKFTGNLGAQRIRFPVNRLVGRRRAFHLGFQNFLWLANER